MVAMHFLPFTPHASYSHLVFLGGTLHLVFHLIKSCPTFDSTSPPGSKYRRVYSSDNSRDILFWPPELVRIYLDATDDIAL